MATVAASEPAMHDGDIYHVFALNREWQVFIAGERVAVATFPSRERAIAWCREEARSGGFRGILVYQDPHDGRADAAW